MMKIATTSAPNRCGITPTALCRKPAPNPTCITINSTAALLRERSEGRP